MSAKDLIKNSVLQSFSMGNTLSFSDICIIAVIACIIGIYIFVVYKNFTHNSFYSKDYSVALAGMSVIVAAIMIAMQSNLIVSLGMVGALSIVRFRTAVKNPLDLLYMFWSISAGIVCGVGLYGLAIALCAIVTVLLFVLLNVPTSNAPKALIIQSSVNVDNDLIETVLKNLKFRYNLSSINSSNDKKESIYEIKGKCPLGQLISEINKLEGILYVSCLQVDGELRA